MTTRTVPESYYYSGQGRLIIGDRDAATGEGFNLRHIGNCTALSVEIAVEQTDHKESMSGQRAIDKTTIKEKKATVKFTAESLSLENLALGLFGETTNVVGSAVVDESHKYVATSTMIPLKYPNVSVVTVKTGANVGAATPVDPTAYSIDPEFGVIHILTAAAFTGANAYVSYTYGASKKLDVFTQSFPEEKYLRFEGLNTVNDDAMLIVIPRVAIAPIPALQLINEEFANVEFTGNVLLDTKIVSGSQFMTQTVIPSA